MPSKKKAPKSVSKSQRKLAGWALSCRKGKNKNCPPHVKKFGEQMKLRDLKSMASTKEKELPEVVENFESFNTTDENKINEVNGWISKYGFEIEKDMFGFKIIYRKGENNISSHLNSMEIKVSSTDINKCNTESDCISMLFSKINKNIGELKWKLRNKK